MKVLFLTLGIYSRTGGIERFGQQVLRSLAELIPTRIRSVETAVLWDSPLDSALAPPAVRFLPARGRKLVFLLHTLRSLLRFAPDAVLLGHVLLLPLAPLIRALRPRTRIMLFAYGSEVWAHSTRLPANPPSRWHRWISRHFVDRVISISRFTAAQAGSVLGIPPSRISILPCAVDTANGHGSRNGRYRPLPGSHRLLTVSRLSSENRYKGHATVIQALPSVLRQFPGTQYFLVGDGPLREDLRSLAAQIGVSSHVNFLGRLSDEAMEQVYSQSHAFVMPSCGEGFGIVFLEAWKHRLPVIAGNRDATPEVVEHEKEGLLVNPGQPAELAAAICRVLASPSWAVSLGEAGHRKLLTHYSHEQFLHRLDSLLAQEQN